MKEAAKLVELAHGSNAMIATAESCTGGLIAAAITDVAGSSGALDRGFVTYSNRAKVEMLGVLDRTLEMHGAVSEPVAAQMARGALERSLAAVAVSVTGIAGPGGGSKEKPVGMVCFGFASSAGVRTETLFFGDVGRAEVRRRTVEVALSGLTEALQAIAERP